MSEQLIRALERHALVEWPEIFKCRCGQWSFSRRADEIKRSRSHAEHIAEQLDGETFDVQPAEPRPDVLSAELCECGQPKNSIRHSFSAASSVDAHEFKPAARPRLAAFRALAEHWLFEMKCDHNEKRDRATCACGWVGTWQVTVGEAAESWAKHALAAMAAPEEK